MPPQRLQACRCRSTAAGSRSERRVTILLTGVAGFIGFHAARTLLDQGRPVLGVDNLNNYYDVRLKEARLAQLTGRPGFRFQRLDVSDSDAVSALLTDDKRIEVVLHLAAQAGV